MKKSCMTLALVCPLSAFAAHPLVSDDTGTQGDGNWQFESNGEVTAKQPDTGRQTLWNSTLTRGVGEALLQALIAAVRALGFRQIVAVIGDGGPASASVRLHEKLGFSHSGRLSGSGYKHGRWLDTVFMQLELNGGTTLPPDPQSWPERRFRGG